MPSKTNLKHDAGIAIVDGFFISKGYIIARDVSSEFVERIYINPESGNHIHARFRVVGRRKNKYDTGLNEAFFKNLVDFWVQTEIDVVVFWVDDIDGRVYFQLVSKLYDMSARGRCSRTGKMLLWPVAQLQVLSELSENQLSELTSYLTRSERWQDYPMSRRLEDFGII